MHHIGHFVGASHISTERKSHYAIDGADGEDVRNCKSNPGVAIIGEGVIDELGEDLGRGEHIADNFMCSAKDGVNTSA